jgi:hypothetical protein
MVGWQRGYVVWWASLESTQIGENCSFAAISELTLLFRQTNIDEQFNCGQNLRFRRNRTTLCVEAGLPEQ